MYMCNGKIMQRVRQMRKIFRALLILVIDIFVADLLYLHIAMRKHGKDNFVAKTLAGFFTYIHEELFFCSRKKK